MNFVDLKNIIKRMPQNVLFQDASANIQNIIFNLSKEEFIPLVIEIGAIPEDIEHDSTEEKLYAKVSDIILAKCFIELNLKAIVLRERANCADVLIKSKYHNYSLVGDAKVFRLSRTAKNQKDFKVESMVHWKGDNDYSVLACPYFQYPQNNSQIYGQAIKGNVSLFSWEYLHLMLCKNIKESQDFNLSELWNYSGTLSNSTSISNMNLCFLEKQNKFIKDLLGIDNNEFSNKFNVFRNQIITRGQIEIEYWQQQIECINELSREEAINMLIKSLKLNEKVNSIRKYMDKLRSFNEY